MATNNINAQQLIPIFMAYLSQIENAIFIVRSTWFLLENIGRKVSKTI